MNRTEIDALKSALKANQASETMINLLEPKISHQAMIAHTSSPVAQGVNSAR